MLESRLSTEFAEVARICRGRLGLDIDTLQELAAASDLSAGAIVALGDEALPAAGLYASLTGRRVAGAKDLRALFSIDFVDVVVTTIDRVSSELFDIVTRIRPGFSPGLVFGDARDLSARCILSAAAFHREIANTAYGELTLTSTNAVATGSIEHADSPPTAPSDLLRARHGLLALHTHCDGFDAQLARHETLCARLGERRERPGMPLNRCEVDAWCHRHDESVSNIGSDVELLSPAHISADILLFDACWSLFPPTGLIDPANCIGNQLATNSSVIAVAGHWRPTISADGMTTGLKKDLSDGMPVGAAVGKHNNSPLAINMDHCLCVLGEPMTRLRRRRSDSDREDPGGIEPRRSASRRSPAPGVSIRDAIFERQGTLSPAQLNALRVSRDLAPELDDDDFAFWSALVTMVPRTEPAWVRASSLTFMEESEHACFLNRHGRQRVARFRAAFETNAWSDRHLGICQRCGVAEDVDASLGIVARPVAGSRIALEIIGDVDSCRIAVVVTGQRKAKRLLWLWPTDGMGVPEREMQLPAFNVQGVGYVSVVITLADRYSVFTYGFNSDADDIGKPHG